ncbi:TonB-dependent receptor domain-containing protein [Kordiimonas lipolytica]|uniref:TonB-dependent receptor domain-containing protein n=1 Tax=Kordiimonas lipolytica TaxID=1662421 RepID=A0ABV8UAT7_9PROT
MIKNKSARFSLLTAVSMIPLLAIPNLVSSPVMAAQVASQEKYQFDISAQNLGEALQVFTDVTGIQHLFSDGMIAREAVGSLRGAYTAEQALDILLEKTDYAATFTGAKTVVIRRRGASGAVPAAKEARANPSVTRTEAEPAVTEFDEIVVTGSRIRRSGTTTPTPVTILDSEALALNGDTRLADTLNELPAIRATQTTGNVNTTDDAQEAGTNFLNLRGLGIDRTLVLVNGRRHVGSRPGSAAVDTNTIPSALVDRIEVITGGASAVYGADAVSGVVNLILKDDFEGLAVDGRFGVSDKGDGETYSLSLTGGTNFADDRGNIYVNATYDKSSVIRASNRSYARENLRFAPNPNNTSSSDGIADQILFENTGFIGTPAGGQVVGPNFESFSEFGGPFTFDSNGNIVSQDMGTLVLSYLSQGGGFVDLSAYDLLAVPVERMILSGGFKYDLSDDMRFFFDAKYARNESETDGQPTFGLAGDFTGIPGSFILADNPYVPEALSDILAADGLDGFYVTRTNVDHGGRQSRSQRDTIQLYAGIEGRLSDTLDYTFHYQYGRSENTTEFINERINSRYLQQIDAILDADGNIVCRDASGGCVPLNILGPNAATSEALAFSHVDFLTQGELTQHVVNFTVTGDTAGAVELPGGPVGFAFGAEYRDESSSTEEGALRNSGDLFGISPVADTVGSYDVWELFAEASLPVLRNVPFAQEFNLEGAVRYADYSTIGSATTWKIGADWTPVSDVRFRAVLSQAVRAPNIGELFAAVEQSNVFLNDPCDVDFINAGSATRASNCAALGIAPGFQSNTDAVTTAILSGGNENLQEETADTLTLGVIVTPSFIPDLSLTVDYWNIDIKDAVNAFPAQVLLNGCVDGDSIDNPLCASVSRGNDGNIQSVSSQLINVASFEAAGFDFEMRYRLHLDEAFKTDGMLDFALTATYLDKLNFFAQEGQSQPDREAGELGDPKWIANLRATYRNDRLTVSLYERFFGSQVFDLSEPEEFHDPNRTGSEFYTDLQVRYSFNDRTDFYVGVNNVFDNAPPLLARVPETRAFGDDAVIYDQQGRFFYFGVGMKL